MRVFLGLIEEHHGNAVTGGVRSAWICGGWVCEDVVVRTEERRLNLGNEQLSWRRFHRRARLSQRRG